MRYQFFSNFFHLVKSLGPYEWENTQEQTFFWLLTKSTAWHRNRIRHETNELEFIQFIYKYIQHDISQSKVNLPSTTVVAIVKTWKWLQVSMIYLLKYYSWFSKSYDWKIFQIVQIHVWGGFIVLRHFSKIKVKYFNSWAKN